MDIWIEEIFPIYKSIFKLSTVWNLLKIVLLSLIKKHGCACSFHKCRSSIWRFIFRVKISIFKVIHLIIFLLSIFILIVAIITWGRRLLRLLWDIHNFSMLLSKWTIFFIGWSWFSSLWAILIITHLNFIDITIVWVNKERYILIVLEFTYSIFLIAGSSSPI